MSPRKRLAAKIGANLRRERAGARVTAEEAAQAAGVHVNTLYSYESGKTLPRGDVERLLLKLYKGKAVTA